MPWRNRIQDGIANSILGLGIGAASIGIVLLLSQIIIDVTGNH